jgi:hypothetical protein
MYWTQVACSYWRKQFKKITPKSTQLEKIYGTKKVAGLYISKKNNK